MKYIVIIGDGMADYPIKELDNQTPLQAAYKPYMNQLVKKSLVGLVKTIPDGMPIGSDVANLSILGCNPHKYYTGRSPLEAIGMNLSLSNTDIIYRCNLVTLSDEEIYENKKMLDYSADEITTREANKLIDVINKQLGTKDIRFFSGIGYRHCMIWHKGILEKDLMPPHDILNQFIKKYFPSHDLLQNLTKCSYSILKNHKINIERERKKQHTANSIWLWGGGVCPSLPDFYKRYGIYGSVISAVPLIKGIGICMGLNSVQVQGATGTIDTNFKAKSEAALKELETKDFVYIHVEAPDECSHRGQLKNKILSIERIDEQIVKPILNKLEERKEQYKLLIMPDHFTPLSLKTHTAEPVPFLLYKNNSLLQSCVNNYCEKEMKEIFIENIWDLMEFFIKKA